MHVLITGGSGMIGKALTSELLKKGYSVGWLSRSRNTTPNIRSFQWDIDKQYIDEEAIRWADIIIHLAGENIAAKRWTKKRKREIIESRIKSTVLLKINIDAVPNKIKTIFVASAIGFYGERGSALLTEDAEAGIGFLSESCIAWENATEQLRINTIRLVRFRIGIVLEKNDGALKEMIKTIPFGIAPVFGNGNQMYSWIHMHDLCAMILFILQNENLTGTYNAVAPEPVSQQEFMGNIREAKNAKAILFPIPAFLIKIILGEMSAVIMTSQNVSSAKITAAGFSFTFQKSKAALQDIFR